MTQRYAAIPESLKRTPQWIVYRLQPGEEKTDKLPMDHRTGRVHDAHDPAIWTTFDHAVSLLSKYDGIGFVFTAKDPFTGIDLDRCRDGDGNLEPWAELVIACFQSYTEQSVSGEGVHIIIRGTLPEGYGHKCNGQGATGRGAIEVYDRLRFFAFTGLTIEGGAAEALPRQEEFEAFCRARLPFRERVEAADPQPNAMEDDDVIDFARRIWPVERFRELFDDGDISGYDEDQNRADMALCNFLAFWTGGDEARIDRLFRRSALMRDKWDERRGTTTYGGLTIGKVVGTMTAFYHAAVETEESGSATEESSPKADKASAWEPPLLDDTVPAEPFPLHVFPAAMAEFLERGASCLTCPVDFLALTALVVAGTAIGRSYAINVKETWDEAPSLYAALVARPGATKSPALALVTRPLWSITEDLLVDYRRQVAHASKEDPRPILRRIAVSDTTCEALAPILAENPRGVALVRDELTAWVTGMNQYKTGGKGADRQFFLSAWAGASLTVDRKGRHEQGPIHIPHPFLSVVGALTPDMIGELADEKTRDDGFIDRLLFTMPDPVRVRWNDETIPIGLSDAWLAAIRSLFSQKMMDAERPRPFFLNFSADAKTLYSAWFDGNCREAEAEDFPRHLEGFWSKMRAYTARLALILDRLHLAYGAAGPTHEVSAMAVHAATHLARYFKTHCRRVRGLIGTDNPDARAVLKWLHKTQRRAFNVREVKQNFRARLAHDQKALLMCLEWLEVRNCIRYLETPTRGGPGRARSEAYEVNPCVLQDGGIEF